MRRCNWLIWQGTVAFLASTGCSVKTDESAAPRELHFSFKGATQKSDKFEFFGPGAEDCVRFEPEGLRIKTSPDFPSDHSSTGVVYNTLAKGDFEVTTDFEILREPSPTEVEGEHTRFTLDVVLDSYDELVALSRRVTQWWRGGTQFGAYTRTWDKPSNRPKERFETFLTKAKTGRLRIVRKGSVASFEAAEGPSDEFKRLQQIPFGTGDLTEVRLVEGGGGPHGWLDVRVTELTIRADALPAEHKSFRRMPWLAATGVVVVVIALIGVRIWYGRRHKPQGTIATGP
jgi:Protein of unknown function (DUF1583)